MIRIRLNNLQHSTRPTAQGLRRTWLVAIVAVAMCAFSASAWGQAPGSTPVRVSTETQMLHGRKYYVHVVETGQTVYSIAKAYKVESYDAVTHQDIHFLHAGDTVWLPCRGQFSEGAIQPAESPAAESAKPQSSNAAAEVPAAASSRPEPTYKRPSDRQRSASTHADRRPAAERQRAQQQSSTSNPTASSTTPPPSVRKVQGRIKVALMMPLHLAQIDQISTTKFDVEQRGKRSYKQFEFIEFYEGVLMALDKLDGEGVRVELNVVDVSSTDTAAVAAAFRSHHVGESDVVVALLLRDAFDKAAELAQEAGIYIVNPMSTRGEICATNPFVVKTQPSVACKVKTMLDNMKYERASGHLIVIHSGSKAEKPLFDEVKRQLGERDDIVYTLFNWSQQAKLAAFLKEHPGASVLSIYDQGRDKARTFVSDLLNKLSAAKTDPPTLYTLNDLTRDIPDVDFAQLQNVNYHTFSESWDMTNTVHVDFLKEFRSRYGTEPTSSLAPTAYNLMLYVCRGLGKLNSNFWLSPVRSMPTLTQPIRLARSGAGLENTEAALFVMRNLGFVQVEGAAQHK